MGSGSYTLHSTKLGDLKIKWTAATCPHNTYISVHAMAPWAAGVIITWIAYNNTCPLEKNCSVQQIHQTA